MEVDEDAEGEEDLEDNAEDNGEVEDKELYCFCQKLSYGEVCSSLNLVLEGPPRILGFRSPPLRPISDISPYRR